MFLSDRITQALDDPENFVKFLLDDIKKELGPCVNDEEYVVTLRRYDTTYRHTLTKSGNTTFNLDAVRILIYHITNDKTDICRIWPGWTPTE